MARLQEKTIFHPGEFGTSEHRVSPPGEGLTAQGRPSGQKDRPEGTRGQRGCREGVSGEGWRQGGARTLLVEEDFTRRGGGATGFKQERASQGVLCVDQSQKEAKGRVWPQSDFKGNHTRPGTATSVMTPGRGPVWGRKVHGPCQASEDRVKGTVQHKRTL